MTAYATHIVRHETTRMDTTHALAQEARFVIAGGQDQVVILVSYYNYILTT